MLTKSSLKWNRSVPCNHCKLWIVNFCLRNKSGLHKEEKESPPIRNEWCALCSQWMVKNEGRNINQGKQKHNNTRNEHEAAETNIRSLATIAIRNSQLAQLRIRTMAWENMGMCSHDPVSCVYVRRWRAHLRMHGRASTATASERTQNDFHVAQKLVHYMLPQHTNHNCGHAQCAFTGIEHAVQNAKCEAGQGVCMCTGLVWKIWDRCMSINTQTCQSIRSKWSRWSLQLRFEISFRPQSINRRTFHTIGSENRFESAIATCNSSARFRSLGIIIAALKIVRKKNNSNTKNHFHCNALHSPFPLSVFFPSVVVFVAHLEKWMPCVVSTLSSPSISIAEQRCVFRGPFFTRNLDVRDLKCSQCKNGKNEQV